MKLKITVELLTPRQVMQAFLAGHKLSNEKYFNGFGNDQSMPPGVLSIHGYLWVHL